MIAMMVLLSNHNECNGVEESFHLTLHCQVLFLTNFIDIISKISDDFQHFFQERTLIWLLVLLPLAACGVNLPFVRLEDLITKPLLG